MAHAALVSLLQSLQNLSHYQFETLPYPESQIQNLKAKLRDLQSSLERIFPVTRMIKNDVADLESQIRDAVFKSQDTIESFLSSLVPTAEPETIPGDLEEIIARFEPIAEKAKNIMDTAADCAALHSLLQTVRNLSDASYPENQIESLYGILSSLQHSLGRDFLVTKGIETLNAKIRDAAMKSEETINSFLSTRVLLMEFNLGDLEEKIATSETIAEDVKNTARMAMDLDALASSFHTVSNLLQAFEFKAPYSDPQIEFLYTELCSIQSFLERFCPFSSRYAEIIKSFLTTLVLSPKCEPRRLDLQNIKSACTFLGMCVLRVLSDLTSQLANEDMSDEFLYENKTHQIVGQEAEFNKVTDHLVNHMNDLSIVTIVGMAGIGKTTLVRRIYQDRQIVDAFHTRAWVTISPEYNIHDILTKLLDSVETRGQKRDDLVSTNNIGVSQESNGQLAQRLHQTLFDARYLVVIDDIWNEDVWNEINLYFPKNSMGSRIILTTRHNHIANYLNPSGLKHLMEPLNDDDSQVLLYDRVFGGGYCPPHLETIGRKIAQNCGGLPLSLTVIGGLLYTGDKTVEYWKFIEEDTHAAASSAHGEEEYLEILTLSYNHLPWRLKGCFLYMGGFPKNSDILLSKLVRLWVAEGFLKISIGESVEVVAKECLEELIDRNLITKTKVGPNGQIKYCGIQNVLHDIAVNKCEKEKFFHGIKSFSEPILEGPETQRRLSVHKNILMFKEEVYRSAKAVAFARSFLFVGSHHHHPYPYSIDFLYLKVLDALTVYFIDFPNEVARMIHLCYLSLTYNGNIPSSIVNLQNLQVLIIRRHPKIIFLSTSMLPVEIWNMPRLRHLYFTETELPEVSNLGFLLENLQSLSNVNAASCTLENLKRFPNLKKLAMWVAKPGALEFHIAELKALEVFKFSVLSPVPYSNMNFLPELAFPKLLRKLSLSGCVIPWDQMTIIGKLGQLEVLKLRAFAFHGPNDEIDGKQVSVWSPNPWEFGELKYLLLEGLDLFYWEAETFHFPSLETLIIRHCYELVEISPDVGNIGPLKLIEIVDCNPSCVASACEIREKQKDIKKDLQVCIYSSWE